MALQYRVKPGLSYVQTLSALWLYFESRVTLQDGGYVSRLILDLDKSWMATSPG